MKITVLLRYSEILISGGEIERCYCQYIDETGTPRGIFVYGQNLPQEPGPYMMEIVRKTRRNGSVGHYYSFWVEDWCPDPAGKIGADEQTVIDWCKNIKGVGQTKARAIFKAFGKDSFRILSERPEKLLQLKGFTKKTVDKIRQAMEGKKDLAELYRQLHAFGLSRRSAERILKTMGREKAEKSISVNPFFLMEFGVSFENCDRLHYKLGMPPDDFNRIEAGVTAVLIMEERRTGSTCLPCRELNGRLHSLLNLMRTGTEAAADTYIDAVADARIAEVLFQIVQSENGKIVLNETGKMAQRRIMMQKEKYIADSIKWLVKADCGIDHLEQKAEEALLSQEFEADPLQVAAITMALSQKISIITGYPGSGKTSVINAIKSIYLQSRDNKDDIVLLSPTGRAARRLATATLHEAYTIHSKLHLYDIESEKDHASEPLNCGLLIIDEVSMVDMNLMAEILTSVRNGQAGHIVLVGDPSQLQSVSCGAVLRDLIISRVVPMTVLGTVHRQSGDSQIAVNAEKIRNGKSDLVYGRDFMMWECAPEGLYDQLVNVYLQETRQHGVYQTVCLLPTRDDVTEMNMRIQEVVNPRDQRKNELTRNEMVIRENDLVMEQENHPEDMVVNGDIGTVRLVDPEQRTVIVAYGEREVTYKKKDLGRLTLAYSMTIHKSQGSEYESVIMALTEKSAPMVKRSLIYTGITRAKDHFIYLGSLNALRQAICNDDENERKTGLMRKLQS